MRTRTRALIGTAATAALVGLSAAPAMAHQCINPDKRPGAGAQLVFDGETDEIVWISKGLQSRVNRGLVDLDTGEGFHGLIGIDFDGDKKADITTWIVGPNSEIPAQAQTNGNPCHGVTNFEIFFSQCV